MTGKAGGEEDEGSKAVFHGRGWYWDGGDYIDIGCSDWIDSDF